MLTSVQRESRRADRLTHRFKVLEEGLLEQPYDNTICHNCKSRHELIALRTDKNNLRCNHCGALTPIRTIRHSRGLAAPPIQMEQTAIAQPNNAQVGRNRIPQGINSSKNENPLEQSIIKKGFQIQDIEYYEPAATSN